MMPISHVALLPAQQHIALKSLNHTTKLIISTPSYQIFTVYHKFHIFIFKKYQKHILDP